MVVVLSTLTLGLMLSMVKEGKISSVPPTMILPPVIRAPVRTSQSFST